MKKVLLSVISITLFHTLSAQQAFYDVTPVYGNGLRFWSNDAYKISLGNSVDYHFGPVTSTSIKTNMDGLTGKGWTWGVFGSVPIAGLNNLGDFQIAGNFFCLGDVGIGTDQPDAKLTVKGDIHTQEVTVDLQGAVAPDFVFEKDYDLKSLEETEDYIQANKHLPEIPSASEMEENGFKLKEMDLMLLQKVEELTLYLIDQNKKIRNLEEKVEMLESEK